MRTRRPYRGKLLFFILPGMFLVGAVCLLLAHLQSAALTIFMQLPIWSGLMWVLYRRAQTAPEWEETGPERARRVILISVASVVLVAVGGMVIHLVATTPHR